MKDQQFFYRVVIRNKETSKVELILLESDDFHKVLTEAKKAINSGVDPATVDCLNCNNSGEWVSVWHDAERGGG